MHSRNWLPRLMFYTTFAFALVTPHLIRAEPTPPAEAQPVDLSCGWSGTWCSTSNGHRGPLQACFRKLDAQRYEVTFDGKFCLLIPFRYTTILCVTGTKDGRVQLAGSRDLGPLFGRFLFRGWASEDRFEAHFWSSDDCGRFAMSRRTLRRCSRSTDAQTVQRSRRKSRPYE